MFGRLNKANKNFIVNRKTFNGLQIRRNREFLCALFDFLYNLILHIRKRKYYT